MYLLGVLFVALGISVSIALHEVGHLLPAKRFGVKITQYMVGPKPTMYWVILTPNLLAGRRWPTSCNAMETLIPRATNSTPRRYITESASHFRYCLLYTSPSPRDRTRSRMPSSA